MRQKHWTEDPLIGFDTETTGTDPKTARILQAACCTMDMEDALKESEHVVYIDPGVPIPPEASAIHGITAETLREKNAWPEVAGIEYLLRVITTRAIVRKYPLVIYNAPYDWPLLLEECRRHAIDFAPKVFILDPLLIDRTLDKYRKGSRTLEAVARFYDVDLKDAHGALADARAALGIMKALIKKYPTLKEFTLEQIQTQQQIWYKTWKDGINDYWQKQGKPDRVEGSWPC